MGRYCPVVTHMLKGDWTATLEGAGWDPHGPTIWLVGTPSALGRSAGPLGGGWRCRRTAGGSRGALLPWWPGCADHERHPHPRNPPSPCPANMLHALDTRAVDRVMGGIDAASRHMPCAAWVGSVLNAGAGSCAHLWVPRRLTGLVPRLLPGCAGCVLLLHSCAFAHACHRLLCSAAMVDLISETLAGGGGGGGQVMPPGGLSSSSLLSLDMPNSLLSLEAGAWLWPRLAGRVLAMCWEWSGWGGSPGSAGLPCFCSCPPCLRRPPGCLSPSPGCRRGGARR